MAEKMEGVLVELKTFTAEGLEVGSKIEFHPYCDYYIDEFHDGYACTGYQDIGAVIDEFGIDVATKVIEGEIVKVERDKPEGFRMTACRLERSFEKTSNQTRYPFPGGRREWLVRK